MEDKKKLKASGKKKGNIFKKIGSFFSNMVSELKLVTWPTKKELTNYTISVVVFVTIMSIVVFGLDAGVSWIINQIGKLGEKIFEVAKDTV